MERQKNVSTLDKTNFVHFGVILSAYLVLSTLVFDIYNHEERSFLCMIFLMWGLLYSFGTDKFNAFEFIKSTDY